MSNSIKVFVNDEAPAMQEFSYRMEPHAQPEEELTATQLYSCEPVEPPKPLFSNKRPRSLRQVGAACELGIGNLDGLCANIQGIRSIDAISELEDVLSTAQDMVLRLCDKYGVSTEPLSDDDDDDDDDDESDSDDEDQFDFDEEEAVVKRTRFI